MSTGGTSENGADSTSDAIDQAGNELSDAGTAPVVPADGGQTRAGTDDSTGVRVGPESSASARSEEASSESAGPGVRRSSATASGTKRPRGADLRAGRSGQVGSGSLGTRAAGTVTVGSATVGSGAGGFEVVGSRKPEAVPLKPLEQPRERFRVLLAAALTTLSLGLLAMVLVAAVAGLTAGAGPAFGPLLAAAVPLWLAAHQVPLTVDGAPLGVLPLLPTAGMLWLVAAVAARATRRLGARCREDCSVVVATLAGTNASAAVLATALPAGPVQATPWAALLGAGLVTAAGAALGGLRVSGLPDWWSRSPVWLRTGLAAARTGAAALAGGGALLLVAALLVDVDGVNSRLVAAGSGFGALLGITLFSLCYLPNALVVSVGWAVGPGVSIGVATASPLFARTGPLPGLPLLAAMPSIRPPSWTVIVFLLPLLAGVLAGLRCRRLANVPANRGRAVVVAAALVAVGVAALAAIVSGRLAGGPFDPVEIPALVTGAAVLGWLGVPAAVVVLVPGRGGRLR